MITDTMCKLVPSELKAKITIIPDGADTERFKPRSPDPQIIEKYKLKNHPVFSYQGGIARHEGLDLLCHAAPHVLKEIPEAKFLIVGRGDFLAECQDIVERNGSAQAFLFTGWVDYAEIPRILSCIDVSVVPMPNVRAAWPIISFKLLEAMASKTLTIVNGLPGILEIVDHEMSMITNADDPIQFARDLIKAYRLSPTVKEQMTTRALKKVQTLDWRLIAQRDAEFYTSQPTKADL